MMRSFVLAFLLLAATIVGAEEPPLAIVGITIVHPERDAAQAAALDQTVVIVGERIAAVGASRDVTVPPEAQVIDGRGRWLIPGLVDAHVHFDLSGTLYARPDIADLSGWVSFAREQARNRARLPETFRAWLRSGVTGVVDVGGAPWTFQVREAARDNPDAPRVAVAGPLASMVARPQLDAGGPIIVKVDTPDEARALVRRTLASRPDYIKVWFIHLPGHDLTKQEAIVRAAGEEAHAAGVRFAVHATELAVAKAALRAGADFLVHSVEDAPVDEEFLTLARQRDVLYCPTLFVYEGYGLALSNRWRPTDAERRFADPEVLSRMDDLDEIPREQLPPWVRRAIEQGWTGHEPPHAAANLRRVLDAGIRVVVGSDAGNIGTLHGPAIFREMASMVQAGLTPLEVLRAATANGAHALGMAGQTGVIAAGALADLVMLEADPLADIGNASRIHAVIKDGVLSPHSSTSESAYAPPALR
jgi:imidazolonepropionase-like amidohydrolase